MADREPWERNNNPEPWTRPDKPAPWLRKNSTKESWDQKDNPAPWENSTNSRTNAFNDLRNAENDAVAKREPSFYTGNGGQSKTNNPLKSKVKGKSFLKGKGAIITILIILVGVGAFLGVSNSLLAPALNSLMTYSTQTSYTSYILRTKFITSGMLNDAGGTVKKGWTGSLKYSKIPNYMRNRLAQYDIDVTGSGKNTRLVWKGTEMDANEFLSKYNSDVEFRETFTKAKRGRVATFFDNIADTIYNKLGISRNLFSKYKQTNDVDTDVANYKDTMEPRFEGSDTTIRQYGEGHWEETVTVKDEAGNTVYNEDGSVKTKKVLQTDYADTTGSSTTGSSPDMESAKVAAGGMILGIAQQVSKGAGIACSLMKIGNMIAITVSANELYQSINYAMGQLESISKMKAGDGDASAVNSLLNFLTTSEETSVSDYSSLSINVAAQISPSEMPETRQTGSPMEAVGIQNMIAGTPATAADTTNYSLERVIKSLGGATLFSATATGVCAATDMAVSIISIATTISGGVAKFVSSFVFQTVWGTAVAATASTFFSFLIPTVAKALFVNVFDTAVGIPAGELFAQGISAANMREGRFGSGQGISSSQAVEDFNKSTNTVLALEAEQDRYRLSPFDTSNRNTFFGSIAYSLLPTFTSTNITGLSSFLRSTSKSFASLLGRVSAEGAGSSYLTTYGDCPLLETIGAVGDLYCNPIVTTDMDLIELDPSDEAYAKTIMDNMDKCDDEGNCKISKNSNLAKYISYCDGRDSPFGVVDQNILSNFEIGNSFTNSIPLVGDILSLINAGIDTNTLAWATGKRCGNTDTNSEFWESEGKYYQRYIEDQRILEQMGAYEDSKNPVVAYQEEYEAEHPMEDTYIAYLSRISGLTPENTETMLAFVLYYNFVENYDPTTRIAMYGDTSTVKDGEEVAAEIKSNIVRFSNHEEVDNPLSDEIIIASNRVVYTDIRNRSYAV